MMMRMRMKMREGRGQFDGTSKCIGMISALD
jgi:hypothetical protein